MATVKAAYEIDGRIVEKVFSKKDIRIFYGDDGGVAYICRGDEVVCTISANCGQNTGFLDVPKEV